MMLMVILTDEGDGGSYGVDNDDNGDGIDAGDSN